jgi:hypothetical protein
MIFVPNRDGVELTHLTPAVLSQVGCKLFDFTISKISVSMRIPAALEIGPGFAASENWHMPLGLLQEGSAKVKLLPYQP